MASPQSNGSDAKYLYLTIMTAVMGIVALAITYYVTVRQDGTVFATAATTIATIVGYVLGKKKW